LDTLDQITTILESLVFSPNNGQITVYVDIAEFKRHHIRPCLLNHQSSRNQANPSPDRDQGQHGGQTINFLNVHWRKTSAFPSGYGHIGIGTKVLLTGDNKRFIT
jgi:hypothetical protein